MKNLLEKISNWLIYGKTVKPKCVFCKDTGKLFKDYPPEVECYFCKYLYNVKDDSKS